MSYIYNAAQDPSAMAFQSQRNNLLNNPAYSVGNGQLGIGAYGTIGGVPIDMLNLPSGLGGGSNNINSILQQFDTQNSGILQLGASLAGPNSQYTNLMQKYSTAVAVEQERAKYQQQLQAQQMQIAMFQQQLAAQQQQQQALINQSRSLISNGATSAAPAALGGGSAPAASNNSSIGAVLALLLMNSGAIKSKSNDDVDDVDNDDDDDDVDTNPDTDITEAEANEVLKLLGRFDAGDNGDLANKMKSINAYINGTLEDLNNTDTDLLTGTLNQKIDALIDLNAKLEDMLTNYGITVTPELHEKSAAYKVSLLTTDNPDSTNDPIDLAKGLAKAIGGVSTTGSKNANLKLLQELSNPNGAYPAKIDSILEQLSVSKDGTLKQKLERMLAQEATLDAQFADVGVYQGNVLVDPTTISGEIQKKMDLIRNQIRSRYNNGITTAASSLPATISYKDAVVKMNELKTALGGIITTNLGLDLTNYPTLVSRINKVKYQSSGVLNAKLNNYLSQLAEQADNGTLTAVTSPHFMNQASIDLLKGVKTAMTADATKSPLTLLTYADIAAIMADDEADGLLPDA